MGSKLGNLKVKYIFEAVMMLSPAPTSFLYSQHDHNPEMEIHQHFNKRQGTMCLPLLSYYETRERMLMHLVRVPIRELPSF
jgi:hypothetical protein